MACELHKEDISPSTKMSFQRWSFEFADLSHNCFSAIRLFLAVHTSGRGCEIKEKSIREKVSWAFRQALSRQDCLPGTQLCSSWSIPLYVCWHSRLCFGIYGIKADWERIRLASQLYDFLVLSFYISYFPHSEPQFPYLQNRLRNRIYFMGSLWGLKKLKHENFSVFTV